jgi:hypothetical protein
LPSGGVHIITGFAVGSGCPSVASAVLAGVASHAVLDALPHADYGSLVMHGVDALAGTALCRSLWHRCARQLRVRALAGALAAVLPDIESTLLVLGKMSNERLRFPSHSGLIPHGRGSASETLVLYGLLLGASWAVVRRSSQRVPAAG